MIQERGSINMNNLILIIPLIIIVSIVLVLINEEHQFIKTSNNVKASVYNCEPKSLDEVKLSFPVKEPTYIPEGYKLEVVDPYSFTTSLEITAEASNRVVLYYSKEPMCHGVAFGRGDVIFVSISNMQDEYIKFNLPEGIDIDKDTLAYFTKLFKITIIEYQWLQRFYYIFMRFLKS
jgi:uncharacterized protein (UPF0333 family)